LYARALGIEHLCVWHGWLSEEETTNLLNNAHVLGFTSLWEGTPATVMQSLAVGLPVICLRNGGYGDVVDSSCGITIEANDQATAVREFRRAWEGVVEMPGRIEALSQGALERARVFTWDVAAQRISESYGRVHSRHCVQGSKARGVHS
jgi:glycosyltransferase involved in cell wall biosynthesis